MEDVHPNVREHLSVPKTQFWGVALKEGEKVQVGFEDRELVITNAAMHSGTKACKVQVCFTQPRSHHTPRRHRF